MSKRSALTLDRFLMRAGLVFEVLDSVSFAYSSATAALQIVRGKAHPRLVVGKQDIDTAKLWVFTQKLSWAAAACARLRSKADAALFVSVPSSYACNEDAVGKYKQTGVG